MVRAIDGSTEGSVELAPFFEAPWVRYSVEPPFGSAYRIRLEPINVGNPRIWAARIRLKMHGLQGQFWKEHLVAQNPLVRLRD